MVMLAGQAPLLGGLRQPGRGAFLGRNGCQLDQFHQALTRGFAVAGLGAVLAAVDHQHAVGQRLGNLECSLDVVGAGEVIARPSGEALRLEIDTAVAEIALRGGSGLCRALQMTADGDDILRFDQGEPANL